MKTIFLTLACSCLLAAAAGAREAAFSGQFDPAASDKLAAFFDAALGGKARGPAGDVVAILVPHAGYEYSGKIAGLAYARLAENYDTVVILAAGHRESVKGAALLGSDFYSTPLGRIEPDRALAAALAKASPLFEERPSAHALEHSVEVQLPFLQRKLKKSFKLLAVVLNTDDLKALKAIGATLAAALKGKKALLVISTDLSHYPGQSDAAAADGTMRLAVESLDPELVWTTSRYLLAKQVKGLETCACGEAAIEAGMEAARLLGASSFQTLKLSDSSSENARAGPDRVVGYLSGLFLRAGKPLDLRLSKQQKDSLLKEARTVLEEQLSGKARPPAALEANPRLNLPAAVFVTLTSSGNLRGCVGTVEPAMTLADAVRYGAVSAALRDRRFQALTLEELPGIKIEISLLSALKPLPAAALKPRVHGVVLIKGGATGLFLPQVWDQLPAKEEFLGELCSQKAGLPKNCWKDPDARLYSFTVDAFAE